jgi:ribonuclease HI
MSDHNNLTDQVPANPPRLAMTNEIWEEIMDTTPIPVLPNPQLEVPPSSRPTELFAVKSNRCTLPAYRFIRKDNDRQMLMFVDGACTNNGLPNARAGWAVCVGPNIVVKGRLEPPEVGSSGRQTSNRAELRSVIVALGLRVWKGEGFNSVVIASDSEYVVKGYCEHLAVWKCRDWKTTRGTDVANKDLWEVLDKSVHRLANKGVQVLFWRIPRELNEADKYAKQAAVSWHSSSTRSVLTNFKNCQTLDLESTSTSSSESILMLGC